MKRKSMIYAFMVSLAALLASCEGGAGVESTLTLSADKASVTVGDKVIFTVKNSGIQDVTAASGIKCVQTGKSVPGAEFVAESEGEWTFVAEYDGMKSNEVGITVVAPVVSQFRKHICLMEFTGQWCAMCPEGATTINFYASQIYPDVLHVLAFHNQDEFELPQEAEFSKKFKFGGYPGYVADMKYYGLVSSGQFSEDLKKASSPDGLHCGIALSSSMANGKADVSIKVFSELSSKYRLAVYVLEDKIVAKQNVSGTYREDYTHRHVVRKMVSAFIAGDDLGLIEAESEKTADYKITLDSSWKAENLEVCALVIGEDGCVNNMAACHLDGGNAEYDRITNK